MLPIYNVVRRIGRALLSIMMSVAGLSGVALFCLAAPPARSTETGTETPVSGQLEQVVVTARKREENLQDVPVSVLAVTSAELQMRSLDSLAAVGQATPNLTFGQEAQSGGSANLV